MLTPLALRVAAAAFAAFTALAIGCTAPPAAPPPPPAPRAAPITASDAGPAEDAAGAGAPIAEAPPPRQLEPRLGAPGSTRGTIACGPKRCDASKEVCAVVAGPSWACLPRDGQRDAASSVYDCDDGTDCPWGKTCCNSFASAATYYVCTTRDADCAIEVCEEGGARCPAGMVCRDHACRPAQIPGARCGPGKVCGGATPLCHWNNGKGECVAGDRAGQLFDEGHAILRCTQNADCGAGYHCCTSMVYGPRESFCGFRCDLANAMQYCTTDADCPTIMPGAKSKCRKPEADLPSWSKLCVVE